MGCGHHGDFCWLSFKSVKWIKQSVIWIEDVSAFVCTFVPENQYQYKKGR